jgi:hypothetical protein
VQTFLQAVHDGNWGDFASVFGVLISLVGFALTIIGLARSKSATERAALAVAQVRERLSIHALSTDLNALMIDIEEIKLLHRFGAWDAMPIRYSAIRRKLFSVKGSIPTLTKSHKSSIQGVIEQFRAIEEIVEAALANKSTPNDVASLNRIATEQSDKLTAVLVAIQQLENK